MRMAICVARRPSTLLVASTTYQSPRAVAEFTNVVDTVEDITNSNHREGPQRRSERRGPWKKGRKCTQRPRALQRLASLKNPNRPGGLYSPIWRAGPTST